MKNLKKYGLLFVVLLALGCTQKTPAEYVEEAELAIIEDDADKAVIVLKNALSSEPRNLKARFLLGSVYFKRGNAASAEKELQIAFEGGYFKNEVLPLYLATLDFLKRNDEIIQIVERLTGLSNEAEAAAQTYKGLALFRKGEISRAKLAVKRAAELAPESPYSRLGRAHHALQDAEVNDALIILDELLTSNPDFMQAVLLQGQLQARQQDFAKAIDSFETYIEQKPGDAQGNFLLIEALLKDEQYEQAKDRLEPLLAKLPNNSTLNEFAGILHYANEDYASAKTAMEQAIANGSNSPTARMVAGVASFQQDKLEQSHNHLAVIQSVLPANHPAKRLFAEVQLRLGYSTDAAQTLQNLGGYDLADVKLFTQTGFDLIKQGDSSTAKKMLELAQSVDSGDLEQQTKVGMLKLSLNDKSGIDDLKSVLAQDPTHFQARLVLAQAYVSDEQLDQAIEVAKQWTEVSPEEITAYNLLAEIYELAGQTELAKQTHQQALKLSPDNPVSLKFMADLSTENGNTEDALELLKRAAESNPEFLDAAFNYLLEAKQQGSDQAEQALALMKRVHEQDPSNLNKALNYARGLVVQNQPEQALTVLNSIPVGVDMPLFYWKGKADSYLALNKPDDALKVYSQWQQLEPKRREPWLLAIIIQDSLRDFGAALDTAKRALSVHEKDGEFLVMEAHYSLMSGNLAVTQRLLANMPDAVAQSDAAQGIKGKLLFAQKKYAEALPLLQANYVQSLDGRLAKLIAQSKAQIEDREAAIAFLESHIEAVPRDLNTRALLAESYMEAMPEKAIEQYLILLKFLPENIIALNNLGWLYGKTGDSDKAVKYAQAAVDLRPENPKLLDTLGVALLKDKQYKRAEEVSEKAFNLEPSNQTYRVHYEQAQKANQ